MALGRRRRPILVVALLTTVSLVLTGCSFWNWLAGKPITRPRPVVPADVAGDPAGPEDSGEPDGAPAGTGDQDPAGGREPGAGGMTGDPGEPNGTADAGDDRDRIGDLVPDRCALWSAGVEPSPGPFERFRLEPVDDSGKDPSFAEFRRNLLDALKRRDLAALEAAVDPQVRTEFGDGGGLEDFRRQWGLDRDPDASPVWDVLADILNLGGIMTGGGDTPRRFTAPYVYALYSASLDPFSHAVVTGSGVNVRAEPSVEAEILDQASHLVVRVVEPEEPLPQVELSDGRTYCWARIQLPSGEIGYIADRFLWSPVGWRAAFEHGEEGWRLVLLVAGD